jgi:uncharacterized protein YndB with AHSA1/START domain
MLLRVGLGLLLVVVVLLAVIATRPDQYRVARSVTIAAPAETIFPLINDFHEWQKWSPYEGLDPNLRKTFSGAPTGPGAVYAWSGNSKAGAGSMTITATHPSDRAVIQLAFTQPFANTAQADFTLVPGAGGVNVTWAMSGRNNFGFKAFSLFVNLDKLIGGDFEKGLAALKRVAEAQPAHPAAPAPATPPKP